MNLNGALILFFLIVIPLGVIWALNTLFNFHIPYSIETWAATFILLIATHQKTEFK